MRTKTFTLNKTERLKSRKAIQALFTAGKSFSLFPFKVVYTVIPLAEDVPFTGLQAAFTVGKKYFKRANARNKVRRQMKEAYRLQKLALQQQVMDQQVNMHVFIVYLGNALPVYTEIYERMGLLLKRLQKNLHETKTIERH